MPLESKYIPVAIVIQVHNGVSNIAVGLTVR